MFAPLPLGARAPWSPRELICTRLAVQLSLYFPDIEGTSLATKEKVHTTDLCQDKISLVVFSSFRSSEVRTCARVPSSRPLTYQSWWERTGAHQQLCEADVGGPRWRQPVPIRLRAGPLFFPSNPAWATYRVPHFRARAQINLQENPLKSFLVSMFLSSLRKTVPASQQPTYLLSHESLEYLREPMGMENKHVGYVFLVDQHGKIRWAGCSWATVDEEEALRKCAHVLVERLTPHAPV